jgi:hypothetical protein
LQPAAQEGRSSASGSAGTERYPLCKAFQNLGKHNKQTPNLPAAMHKLTFTKQFWQMRKSTFSRVQHCGTPSSQSEDTPKQILHALILAKENKKIFH